MSTHKHIDKICLVAAVLSLVACMLLMNGGALGLQGASRSMGYEDTLFDTGRVHTIDIVIDDWDAFLETAESEVYSLCSVVIDGEAVKNVGIRGKGNTSLSTVSSMGSNRYSFKIEFDQYDSTTNYRGLDKLCLNNLIQDNTCMKDYLTYQLMHEFGADAPLCSYAYLTVNGEDWGLYLAVEAVEESFLQRNYGSNYGSLYKPDSLSMGGGRGNGRDFDMSDFTDAQSAFPTSAPAAQRDGTAPWGFGGGNDDTAGGTMPAPGVPSDSTAENGGAQAPDTGGRSGFGGGFDGIGSSDVKLQYIDDSPDSYSNIFDNAKTDITQADKTRLISALKQLSAYENLDQVVDVEEVLRYFVVHNYVVNGDSYTGSMIHNYYLYEKDGQLSMIPWDYNLAFGTFQGNSASAAVNDDIDAVLSDRPMQAWIFSDEEYTRQYYALYAEMLEEIDIQGIIDDAYTLIAPYVETDPTAFCTYEEFQTGAAALKEFCALRTQSVRLQLSGSEEIVDTGNLNLSDMGTMGGGMGGRPGDFSGWDDLSGTDSGQGDSDVPSLPGGADTPNRIQAPDETQHPDGSDTSAPDDRSERGSFNEAGGNPPDNQGDGFGDMPAFAPDDWSGQDGSSRKEAALLAASVLALAAGLVIAFCFKRR